LLTSKIGMIDRDRASFRLDAVGLAARRGGRTAFAGASITIGPGDVFLLRGPNGAGKSTLLRVLAGRLKPERGTIALKGAGGDLGEASTLVSHADAVKANLTAEENLRFWRDLYGADEARCAHAVAALEIGGFLRQRASTLSQGQRRRVALCRPLLSGRPLWLFDEPSAGMDAASIRRILALIEAHAAGGGGAVIATHEPLPLNGARVITLSEAA
jgi:heme exporter protein A